MPLPAASARWHRRRPLRVLCGTFLALLVVLEVTLRLYLSQFAPEERRVKYARAGELPAERSKYAPHPYLVYALNPDYRSLDGLNRHNSLGFRGDEIALDKASGTYRIVCLGGSTVYDTEIEDHRASFPAQLELCLKDLGYEKVEVINGGVGGYTSFETLIDVALRILELGPDLLVVYHNSNDVHGRLVPQQDFRFDNAGYRTPWRDPDPWWDRVRLLRYLGVQWGFSPRNTLAAHTQARSDPDRDLQACLEANGTQWFERNTREIIALAQARGAAVMLTSFATCPAHGGYPAETHYRRGFEQNNSVLARLGTELRVPFYDFAAEMPRDLELWHDGVHNTAAGARLKAELFAAFLSEHLLTPDEDG